MFNILNFQKILIIKQKNMLEVAVLYPEFFKHSGCMYWDQDFNKSIGERTVRHTYQQMLWLCLAAFRCQTTKVVK